MNEVINTKPLSEAKTSDLRNLQTALNRASQAARAAAKQYKTPLIIQQNGQMVKLVVH
jgi:hypothetical protein